MEANWNVCAVVGPLRPALSTLYNMFLQEFNFPKDRRHNPINIVKKYHEWADQFNADLCAEENAQVKMKELGYEGADKPELFVSWLIRNHGCTKADVEEFYVSTV